MPSRRMQPEEIQILHETLTLSDAEFASRIGLEDRRMVKMLESGEIKPTEKMHKLMMKMLQRTAGRSPKLKRLLESIRSRIPET